MIADYRENGVDMHNEFIAPTTDNYERAVYGLADVLERQGLSVSCITVCPGAKSFKDLQEMGKEVCAIDISPLSNEVMKQRGVKDSRLINLFDETFTETFDTILMLMNGSGIIGTLDNMPVFFQRMKRILRPEGYILMDSSDLRYLFEEEDGSMLIDLAGDYYGEVDFQMQYKDIKGDTFDWLYIDFQTLSLYASEYGFKAELIKEGKHYDYLAKLSLA